MTSNSAVLDQLFGRAFFFFFVYVDRELLSWFRSSFIGISISRIVPEWTALDEEARVVTTEFLQTSAQNNQERTDSQPSSTQKPSTDHVTQAKQDHDEL
eukprot:m.85209 g.85209  ORF g.85209 m.85209 type:complete len:99 (-) comp14416_c1_seq7:121-417(-)